MQARPFEIGEKSGLAWFQYGLAAHLIATSSKPTDMAIGCVCDAAHIEPKNRESGMHLYNHFFVCEREACEFLPVDCPMKTWLQCVKSNVLGSLLDCPMKT